MTEEDIVSINLGMYLNLYYVGIIMTLCVCVGYRVTCDPIVNDLRSLESKNMYHIICHSDTNSMFSIPLLSFVSSTKEMLYIFV